MSPFNGADDRLIRYGATVLTQSTLMLAAGLAAGSLLRRRGAALRSLVYRAALVAAVLAPTLSITLAGRVQSAVYLLNTNPAPLALSLAPSAAGRILAAPSAPTAPLRASARAEAPPDASLPAFGAAAMSIWTAGAVAILVWLAGCGACLRGVRGTAHTIDDPAARALLQQLCESRGIRPPLLLASRRARSPFVAGIREPAILIPTNAEFDTVTLRAVLAHELAHVARRDVAWALLARIVCAVAWPQPLAWALLRQLDQASEEACDEEVLLHDCAPRVYARCLVTLAERFLASAPERALGTGVAPRGSALARRVRRILDATPLGAYAARGLRLPIVIAAGLGVAGSLLLVSAYAPNARPLAARSSPVSSADIIGRVLHADGSPAVGIRVFAIRTEEPPESPQPVGSPWDLPRSAVGSATTNAAGDYRLAGLLPGGYFLEFLDPAGKSTAAALTTQVSGSAPARAPDTRLSPGVELTVAVLDDTRPATPLEGVHVHSFGRHHPRGSRLSFGGAVTGSDGQCRLRVLPGHNDLVAIAPDAEQHEQPVDVPDRERASTILRLDGEHFRSAVLVGRIVRDGGNPFPGVRVMAQMQDQPSTKLPREVSERFSGGEARSTADGTYRIAGLVAAPYNVAVEEPTGKWVAAAAEGVRANVGETRRIADLVLTAGAVVQGTVTNAETGEPLKGLSVGSYGPHRPRSSAMIIGCETDERGRYSLRVAPGENYIYVADSRVENAGRRGHNDATIFLRKGETKTLDFRVTVRPAR